MNGKYYFSVLKIFLLHILEKRHEPVEDWTLCPDNICQHAATSIQQYISKWKIKIMPQPPYFQILHLTIFSCFRRWRRSFVAKNLIQILKSFHQASFFEVFEAASRKMLLYLFWKATMGQLHIIWGKELWKRMIYFLCKSIPWYFVIFVHSFYGMSFISHTFFLNDHPFTFMWTKTIVLCKIFDL